MLHSGIKDYPAWYTKTAINLLLSILFEEYLSTVGWGLILKMVVPTMFEVVGNLT
jgi:hypothetical protein